LPEIGSDQQCDPDRVLTRNITDTEKGIKQQPRALLREIIDSDAIQRHCENYQQAASQFFA